MTATWHGLSPTNSPDGPCNYSEFKGFPLFTLQKQYANVTRNVSTFSGNGYQYISTYSFLKYTHGFDFVLASARKLQYCSSCCLQYFYRLTKRQTKGAFFWGYSGYSYSGLGITEYTEFQFRKEHSLCFRSGNEIGGDLRTTISTHATGAGGRVGFPAKNFPKERVFCLFRINRIPSILFILLSGAE